MHYYHSKLYDVIAPRQECFVCKENKISVCCYALFFSFVMLQCATYGLSYFNEMVTESIN